MNREDAKGAKDELPAGWVQGRLDDLIYTAGRIGWRGLKADEYTASGPIFLSVFNLNKGDRVDFSDVHHISQQRYDESPEIMLQENDILLAKDGAGIGKIGIVKNLPDLATVNSSLLVIRASDVFVPEFLFFFLKGPQMQEVVRARITGSATPHLFQRDIRKFTLLIPPLDEQHRIVAKIEELFTRLDAGVASLKRVQAALKRYKASILKAACEGRLVPQDPADEPASALLARILAERRVKWEADQRAKGKDPKKLKYEEPPAPDTAGLPELPAGWCWVTLGQISSLITSGSRGWAEYYSDDGVLFIRAQDINTDNLRLEAVAHVDLPKTIEGARTRVYKNDLLVTITGANVTKTALVRQELPEAYVSQHVGLVRPVATGCAEYLYLWVVSPAQGRGVLEKAAYGAGKPGLSLINLNELPVALPPLAEQHRIVAEVERRLSVVAEVEQTVEDNLARAGRLRQAILHRAFTGRLVSQDPADEPAEKLLGHIRAERGAGEESRQGTFIDAPSNGQPRRVSRPTRERKIAKAMPKRKQRAAS